jgi:hypothetical protein
MKRCCDSTMLTLYRARKPNKVPFRQMRYVEIEHDHLESEVLNFCLWCSSTAIPRFFDIREAENLCSSKWHCLDFIWSVINHIYPFLSHFDFIKSQKFEIEFVIWKGSRSPNQVKMTQYLIFYCIIEQNGLKKSEVTKTAVLWSHCHESQLIYQLNDLLSTGNFSPVGWRASSIIEHDQTMACSFPNEVLPLWYSKMLSSSSWCNLSSSSYVHTTINHKVIELQRQ